MTNLAIIESFFVVVTRSARIESVYCVVITIGKHIMPDNTLTGTSITVCIEESANLRVVVTGLEVVEAGFGVVVVAAVAEG